MRGFICLTAHPGGCEKNVINQIEYVKSKGPIEGPKKVLVIGASTGFGLASRITAAFGSNAATIAVFFEKPPVEGKTATPGWYNSVAFHKQAEAAGLYAKSINGDAFSNEVKQKAIDLIKADLGQIDLVIYSLASPVRMHPVTGILHRSVLKPVGNTYTNKTVDFHSGFVSTISIDPCSEEDITNTVAVMGGEDWEMWIDAMIAADVLAPNAFTLAYSYIGPSLTEAVYRKGTIGRAFAALESGATGLKIFPAEMITPPVVKALRAVLPPGTVVMPVGGITPSNMRAYLAAGVDGFGIGSALYKPGMPAAEVAEHAMTFIAACPGNTRA